MNLDLTLKNYLEELSSNAPTPGGGNVAALSAVLACSLGIMVCNLTFGKKKYADVQDEVGAIKDKLESLSTQMQELGRRDNEAFDKVMDAFKLPKETDDQKRLRADRIDEANYQAALVPSEVIDKCNEILPGIKRIVLIGNQNSLSDAGVALSLLSTASYGALLNVLINCSGLQSNMQAVELARRAEVMADNIKKECDTALGYISSKLKG
jgi:formiminotetrahydrofolate cyclodeaminase